MAGTNGDKQAVRERIAEDQVNNLAEQGLLMGDRERLIKSLVRQWIHFGGWAVLICEACLLRFQLIEHPDGRSTVRVTRTSTEALDKVLNEWAIDFEDRLSIIERLNMEQRAQVVNTRGERLLIRIEPHTNLIHVTPLRDEYLD